MIKMLPGDEVFLMRLWNRFPELMRAQVAAIGHNRYKRVQERQIALAGVRSDWC